MLKIWVSTFISLILAIIFWLWEIATMPSNYESVLSLSAVCFSILFVCLLCVGIVKQINKNISSYRIFAVTDIIIGSVSFVYAVYDIIATADSEYFPGLTGGIIFIFVIPSVLFLLLIDYIICRKSKPENKL